jgi:AcrR family transcriptional regulator
LTDVLAKIDKDKKIRIINASMEEFGEKGFELASTNSIVKNAKISKGLLFHYFSTKQELFDYVQDFAFTTMVGRLKAELDLSETDLIARILSITKIKMGVIKDYPYLYDFGTTMYQNMKIEEVKKMIETYDMSLYLTVFTQNIDLTVFREGLDPEMTRATIQRSIEKKSEEMLASYKAGKLNSMDDIFNEFSIYSEFLRKAFYKEAL